MTTELVECSGYLTYDSLSSQELAEVRRIVADAGLDVDVQPNWLEFESAGRAAHREIFILLHKLAPIFGDADGEVICELDRERAAPDFEFYSIRGGKLLRQKGHIVREPAEEVVGEREIHHVA